MTVCVVYNVIIVFVAVRYVPSAKITTAGRLFAASHAMTNQVLIAFFDVVETVENQERFVAVVQTRSNDTQAVWNDKLAMFFESFPYAIAVRDDTNWTSLFSSHSVIATLHLTAARTSFFLVCWF